MNVELKEILEELKDGAENSTVIYATFDGSDEEEFENDKLLTPKSCKLLFNYITQLQTRIAKAIDYIEETTKRNDELNCTKLLAVNQVEQLLEILKGKSE